MSFFEQIAAGTITKLEGGTVQTNVLSGTLNVGTATVSGNVGVSSGTINVGTFTNTGTNVNIVTGTVNVGTVAVSSLPSGGTILNLAAGTLGTILGVGGTVSVNQVVGGTTVNVNTGTINVGSVAVTSLPSGGTLLNLAAGTITSVANVAGGTVQLNQKNVNVGTPFTTYGTSGAAVWGTIIAAAGAGTKQYVENVDIVVHSGTVDVAVTNSGIGGSIGAGVLARGQFPPGGGLQRSFFPPVASGTNGTLSYWLGGAGTVSIDIVYWQGV